MKRKLVIAGKNNIAVDILEYVLECYCEQVDVSVICNKTEIGHGKWQRSLKTEAKKRGVPEYELEDLYLWENLIFLSLEYDRIIKPEKFISKELYNIHFSLLPQYRGMYTSAIPILNGEKYSGVTLHRIDRGIDTGDIIEQKKIELDQDETSRSLYLKYIDAGIFLVKKNLKNMIFSPHEIQSIPQCSANTSYYSQNAIDYSHLSINLNQTASSINRQIRAFSFREYQMPKINGMSIIASEISKRRSQCKPGTIILETDIGCVIATIDYDLLIYYDRFDELMRACVSGNMRLVKEICTVKQHVNAVNEEGETPIMAAEKAGNSEIVKYLLCVGAE